MTTVTADVAAEVARLRAELDKRNARFVHVIIDYAADAPSLRDQLLDDVKQIGVQVEALCALATAPRPQGDWYSPEEHRGRLDAAISQLRAERDEARENVKRLMDPIVRAKMLEPPGPILMATAPRPLPDREWLVDFIIGCNEHCTAGETADALLRLLREGAP